MKKLLVFLFFPFFLNAQLSSNTQVYIATIQPGAELYSSFGHSILVFQDSETGLNEGFNYGTFDFNTPNFYWKFLKGTLPYSISVYPFDQESNFYLNYEGRGIDLQELDLDSSQVSTLYLKLKSNLLPENKYYAYQFFFDNCSSRLRDLLLSVDGIKESNEKPLELEGKSFRDWMNDYLPPNNWVTLGMNLALGFNSNKTATVQESVYLPDNLNTYVNYLQNGDKNLVLGKRKMNPSITNEKDSSFNWFGPIPILPIILILLILSKYSKYRIYQFAKFILYPILFLLLIIIGFLSFFSNHLEMVWNPAILLFLPLITAPYVFFKPIIYKLNQILIFISIIASIYEMTLFVPIIFVGAITWIISSNFINKKLK